MKPMIPKDKDKKHIFSALGAHYYQRIADCIHAIKKK